MKKIPLTQNNYAVVDNEDFEELSKYKWKLLKTKTQFYALQSGPRGKRLLMHRILLKVPKGKVVDHINGNGLDNRRSNLRICTQSQNMQNSGLRKNNTSGFKGVCLDKRRGKWIARIRIGNKRITTKQFDSPELAHKAYCELSEKYHKEYAKNK